MRGGRATLAEECAETIVAPWVIENEVNLTYPATVTVSIDRSQASTFPVTAVSWSLEAKVDGAVTLDPITGSINDGGRIRLGSPGACPSPRRSAGSRSVDIVFLDSAGRQVGTGVSAGAANDDPSDPPSCRLDHDPADPGHDHLRDAVQARGHHGLQHRGGRLHLVEPGHRQRHARRQGHPGGGRHRRLHPGRRRRRGLGAGRPLLPPRRAGRRERRHDRARPGDRPGLRAAPVPPARPVRRARRPGQPRAARARPRDPESYHVRQVALDADHRRADLGLLGVVAGRSRCRSRPPRCTPRGAWWR